MAHFKMSGDNLYDNYGHPIASVSGNIIKDNYSHPIASVDDVKRAIQGAKGTMTDVALWWFFIHKP